MRRAVSILVGLFLLVGLGAASLAGPRKAKKKVRQQFLEFGVHVVDGRIRKPTIEYTSARKKAEFERLARLKRSFVPQMMQSAKDRVFK